MLDTGHELNANREYKDRLFKFIFGNPENKKWTLSLYNAVNGSSYTNPEDIKITTLKDVIYMNMRNDVSFLIANTMNFYESQSTYNPNMPMRYLIYAGMVYSAYVNDDEHDINMYSTRQQKFPVPKLACFYNGKKETEDVTIQYLRDAFPDNLPENMEPDIFIRVKMININYGKNRELLNACLPLRDYSLFIHEIREILAKNKDMTMDRAIGLAIDKLPKDSLIKPFLSEHKAEVTRMCITEYDEYKTMEKFKREGREEGWKEGREEGEARLSSLLKTLMEQGKNEDVQRVLDDKEFRKQMYKKYDLAEM